MKWFDRWFVRKVKWAWDHKYMARDADEAVPMPATKSHLGGSLSARGINFTVYTAEGGIVLEFSNYNSMRDEKEVKLYIIPEGEDWGKQVAKCVTAEAIRQR